GMPVFNEHLEALCDYRPAAMVCIDQQGTEARDARLDLIRDYYEARSHAGQKGGRSGGATYRPILPEQLYLNRAEWNAALAGRTVVQLSGFAMEDTGRHTLDLGGRRHEGFAPARTALNVNLFEA